MHPIYIRTYRNQIADWLSREDLQAVREQLAAEGWTEVATGLQWEDFLRDAERSALVYPTGDDPQGHVARQLTHPAEPAPKPLRQVCLRVPWQPLHVEEYPEITSCGIALRLFGVWSSEDHATVRLVHVLARPLRKGAKTTRMCFRSQQRPAQKVGC